MSRLIVSLIGYGGSGKSSAARHLSERYGFAVFTISSVIHEYASAHGLELRNRSDFARVHAEIIETLGPDHIPSVALGLPAVRLCVDGLRSRSYAEAFRAAEGKEIAFACPVELRFAHIRNHPDKVRYPNVLAEFIRGEQEDEKVIDTPGLKFETGELMRQADYHIDASGTLAQTLSQLDKIIEPLLAGERQTKA